MGGGRGFLHGLGLMAFDERTIQRRVAGPHDERLHGVLDVLLHARGSSVLDLGCNRGLVGYALAANGAKVVHGVDNYDTGIAVAKEIFADIRSVESKFEVVDLSKGYTSLAPFHGVSWDIVLALAVIHKIKRQMDPGLLEELIRHLGRRTKNYFVWRATSEKFDENEAERVMLDRELGSVEMRRIHTSYISHTLGVAAIWARGY